MPEFELPQPPADCESSLEHEAAATKLATTLEKQIDSLLGSGDVAPMVVSRCKELSLAVVRLRKLASELALAREQRSYETWLVREYGRLHGQAPELTPRPRLKRKKNEP